MLQDFETQLGRFTENASIRDDAIFTLQEVLELETIFKRRSVDAIDSGLALRQYHGLNFLWILEQIDPELTANKKKSIITDNTSLVKVISYCTSLGTITTKIVTKTRGVDQQAIKEFINIDEAYHRIEAFVSTDQFRLLPNDDQMNAIAFLLIMERVEDGSGLGNYIAEDAVIRMLNQLENQKSIDE